MVVLDDDYTEGIAESIAYKLIKATGKKVATMGLKNRSAGFSKSSDNLPPNKNEIVNKAIKIISNKK